MIVFSLGDISFDIIAEMVDEFPEAVVEYKHYWTMDHNGQEGYVGKFPYTILFQSEEDSMIARLKWNLTPK